MGSKADETRSRVEEAISPPLQALDLDVEAVEITPAGKRRVLRVAVDGDSGVSLDLVAEATRAISEVLDDSDVMGELPYTLEVTSRGVDRPLTLPRHWRRNADRLVRVTLSEGGDPIVGRIVSGGEESVRLSVDGAEQEIGYDAIATAQVQVEFNRKNTPETEGTDEAGDA